jgi:NAD(P)H dehydrogenase (quinone)
VIPSFRYRWYLAINYLEEAMIIVTGATGQLGRRIVEQLLLRVPVEQVGLSVRDPEKARVFAEQGVRVRSGSFTDPAGLARAFEGASQVLVVSVDKLGDEAIQQHRVAIEAAATAGAGRIVYTSHMGASPSSHFVATRDHAATEELLRASGVPFTSLRNGFYAASVLQFMGPALQTGTIELPEDGPVSWTTHADLAEAAAVVLTDEGRFDGPTPPLTAAEAVDFDRVAAIASELTGKTITRVTVSDDDYRASMADHGVPGSVADMLLGIFAASRAGEFAAVAPTLATLLGRTPTGLEAFLRDEIASDAKT